MTIRHSAALLMGMTLLLTVQLASAQSTAPRQTAGTTASAPSDNTKSNKVDPSNSRMTADAQKNDSSDLTLTQQIRKNIMADKTLSTYAHNVKVVAVGGTVTLNGVVRTAEEKSKVSAIAAQVAGKNHIVDELKVAPSKS
jgi:hyperosmotically inducible protein